MNATAGLGFAADDEAPLVAAGDALLTRAQVRAAAEALAEALRATGVARALVQSDDPVTLLAALDGCARQATDLFVAHTVLPEQTVAEIVARHGIEARIEEGARRISPTGTSAGTGTDRGRVHLMTSGTTGTPKIAAHTLDALLSRARRAAEAEANQKGRWLLTYVPTGFAGVQVMLTAAVSGGLIVVPSERTPAGFVAAARRWNVTHVSATPTFFRSFLMIARPESLALKQITLGAEGADQATLDRVARAFPAARLTHVYASTEAGVAFAVHDGREGFPKAYLDAPVQGVELRIAEGFLHVRTPNAMRGYVSDGPDPAREDGWLATADRCEIDGDRVRFLGRGDSTINVAGFKVYPFAVESFLLSLPNVREARVYGAPNPVSGALVCADVVLEAGLTGEAADAARRAVLAACREKLPRYEVPRALRVVDVIDVGASGKKG